MTNARGMLPGTFAEPNQTETRTTQHKQPKNNAHNNLLLPLVARTTEGSKAASAKQPFWIRIPLNLCISGRVCDQIALIDINKSSRSASPTVSTVTTGSAVSSEYGYWKNYQRTAAIASSVLRWRAPFCTFFGTLRHHPASLCE